MFIFQENLHEKRKYSSNSRGRKKRALETAILIVNEKKNINEARRFISLLSSYLGNKFYNLSKNNKCAKDIFMNSTTCITRP